MYSPLTINHKFSDVLTNWDQIILVVLLSILTKLNFVLVTKNLVILFITLVVIELVDVLVLFIQDAIIYNALSFPMSTFAV